MDRSHGDKIGQNTLLPDDFAETDILDFIESPKEESVVGRSLPLNLLAFKVGLARELVQTKRRVNPGKKRIRLQ